MNNMEITMENLKGIIPFKEKVKEKCLEVLKWLDEYDTENIYVLPDEKPCCYGNSMYISIGDNNVEVNVVEYWSYSGKEDHYYDIPFEWIVNDDWKEPFLLEIKRKEEVRKEYLKKKQEDEEKMIKMKEREEYERLKTKYEMGLLD